MPTQACVNKARLALAEEAGRIATLTEKEISGVDTDYILSRVPETTYQWGMGENPRGVRYQVTPPLRTEYQAILNTGNRSIQIPNPNPGHEGEFISTFGDTHGRGCAIPAEKLFFGYDEFGRCLRATAMETDPVCIIDLLQKYSWSAFLKSVRDAMPRYGKEYFGQELLRQVVRLATRKYSIAEGLPVSLNTPSFPAVPTGGLSIPALTRIGDPLRVHGWNKGAKSTTVNGQPAIQVYAGRNAIEFAILKEKQDKGLSIKTHLWEDDGRASTVKTVYGDIEFIVNPFPTKGFLVPVTGGFQFVEIPHRIVVAAGKEGVVVTDNDDYNKTSIAAGGENYRVMELFHIVHPRAMERQAAGAIPSGGIDGMTIPKNFFNFEVMFLNDWRVQGSADCNKDQLYFQFRMVHAYAPYSENPELMTAGIFLAAQPQFTPHDPIVIETAATLAPVTLAPLASPRADTCAECDDPAFVARQPILPTCDNLFPTNGVGVMQFHQTAYSVSEDVSGITITVERAGGNQGAASVHYGTSDGTAVHAVNYTTTAGTLNWADGEAGIKAFVVPILNHAGDDDGKTITLTLSSATGAALGTPTTATVTIVDTDHA